MAILRIRDKNGNVQEVLVLRGEKGEKGDPGDPGDQGYVLTEADKQEIAGMVPGSSVDLSNYYTKEEVNTSLTHLQQDVDKLLIVTIDPYDSTRPSHTLQQIRDYVENGGYVVLEYGYMHLPLYAVSHREADFIAISSGYCVRKYTIDKDGLGEFREYYVEDVIDSYIANEKSTLIVTVNEDGETASHTARQIYDWVQNGGTAVFYDGESYTNLTYANSHYVTFVDLCDDLFVYFYNIDIDGLYNYSELRLANDHPVLTQETVQSMIDASIAELPVYDGTYREVYDGEVEDV